MNDVLRRNWMWNNDERYSSSSDIWYLTNFVQNFVFKWKWNTKKWYSPPTVDSISCQVEVIEVDFETGQLEVIETCQVEVIVK